MNRHTVGVDPVPADQHGFVSTPVRVLVQDALERARTEEINGQRHDHWSDEPRHDHYRDSPKDK